jgi:hypothetical protein
MPDSTLLGNIPDYVAAVGALGVAAFGMVEALGKTLFVFPIPGTHIRLGLPYVGFNRIEDLLKKVAPAMEASYGKDFRTILRQQYRAGRSQGQAPESIRQGVRLGLPFLSHAAAVSVIEAIWGLPAGAAASLATALTTPMPAAPPVAADGAPALALPPAVMVDQALAARFATALDTRVKAAFDLADQVYQTRAQFWAGAIAIGLSLGYHYYTADPKESADPKGWAIALLIGLVAVPLAPAAKDLSSSLSGALAALGSLRPGSK